MSYRDLNESDARKILCDDEGGCAAYSYNDDICSSILDSRGRIRKRDGCIQDYSICCYLCDKRCACEVACDYRSGAL